MLENLLVIAIVAAVLALVIRSLYRTVTGRGTGCGCGKQACTKSGTTSRDRSNGLPGGGVADPAKRCRTGGVSRVLRSNARAFVTRAKWPSESRPLPNIGNPLKGSLISSPFQDIKRQILIDPSGKER